MRIPGPLFLLIYTIFSGFVCYWLNKVCHGRKLPDCFEVNHHLFSRDPYKIAFLRRAGKEVVRVAIVLLVDRGLLEIQDGKVKKAADAETGLAYYPIEKAILTDATTWKKPSEIENKSATRTVLDEYENELRQEGLIVDSDAGKRNLAALVLALVVTVGVAVWRIDYALSRGRHNIGFLIILAIIATIVLLGIYFTPKPLTVEGEATLKWLKQKFASLEKETSKKPRKSGKKSTSQNQETVLLGAVFGVGILEYDFIKEIYPLPPPSPSSGNDSWDHSSIGSSGCGFSSGCGGGGGCGGGCGGCG